MCTVLLPPGVNPNAVNKYIKYHISNKKKSSSINHVLEGYNNFSLNLLLSSEEEKNKNINSLDITLTRNVNSIQFRIYKNLTLLTQPQLQIHVTHLNKFTAICFLNRIKYYPFEKKDKEIHNYVYGAVHHLDS